jgi:aminocarboxymuconate-semialdehyde decarboxylase
MAPTHGDLPFKIDLHTHILPETWPDLRERYGYGGFVRLEHHKPCCARMMIDDQFFREVADNCWDPARRMFDADTAGVNVQVLSTVPVMFSYWARPEHTLDLSRILNDHIADVVRRHPKRFTGLGTLPMQAPDMAVRELERCVRELGLPGVQIGSHINEWNLSDPQLFGVFEAAAALGAAVFVHPWEMMGQDRMKRYWLPWLVGMPAICSVIFGGVLERLPALRIGFAHGGGSFCWTIGRIEHGFNCRPDLVAIDNQRNPREYLGRFYIDSLVHDPDVLRHLIKLVGHERIALGSDYPFPLGEDRPGSMIEAMMDLHETTRKRLLAGTALEFLGLDRGVFL